MSLVSNISIDVYKRQLIGLYIYLFKGKTLVFAYAVSGCIGAVSYTHLKATGAMAVLVAMLYERYKAGKYPIALVSMDNCSQNGAKLRESVLTMTEEWKKAGFVDDGFISYVRCV